MSCTLSLLLAASLHISIEAQHWPQFRGRNASGVSETGKPPAKFGPNENVLWKVEVPGSPSSPCIWENRIFLTAFVNQQLETRSYDRSSGKLLWVRHAPAEKIEEFHLSEGSPAASTPATDGQRIVSYFGSYGVICYDFEGNELWKHPLPLARTQQSFGTGGSPIIAGKRVFLNRDESQNPSLLALDLHSGEKLWEAHRPDSPTSYGTPMIWKHGNTEELIMSGSTVLKAYDPSSGQERWTVRGVTVLTCTTPVAGENLLYFAGWSPGKSELPTWARFSANNDKDNDQIVTPTELGPSSTGTLKAFDLDQDGVLTEKDWQLLGNRLAQGKPILLAIKPGGKGDITESHIAWSSSRGLPYVPSPLYYKGRVYLVKDGGLVSSFDGKTGQPYYEQERINALGNYYASPVAADDRIYFVSLNGKITAIKAGGNTPEILHQAELGERIAATPALADDKIYIRTDKHLWAFGGGK